MIRYKTFKKSNARYVKRYRDACRRLLSIDTSLYPADVTSVSETIRKSPLAEAKTALGKPTKILAIANRLLIMHT